MASDRALAKALECAVSKAREAMGALVVGQLRHQYASPSHSIEISRTSRSIPCIWAEVYTAEASHSSARISELNLVHVDLDLACADA